MRPIVLSAIAASLAFTSAPSVAQNTDDDFIYGRSTELNNRINMALADRALSRRQANKLYLAVQRVQQSADRVRDRDGSIEGGETDRLNQRLTDIERALPPQEER